MVVRNGMGFPNLPDMNKVLNFQYQTNVLWDEPGVGGGGYNPPTPPPPPTPPTPPADDKPKIEDIVSNLQKAENGESGFDANTVRAALEDLQTLGISYNRTELPAGVKISFQANGQEYKFVIPKEFFVEPPKIEDIVSILEKAENGEKGIDKNMVKAALDDLQTLGISYNRTELPAGVKISFQANGQEYKFVIPKEFFVESDDNDNNGGDTPSGDTPGGGNNPVLPPRWRSGVTASAQLTNQVVVKFGEPFVGPVLPSEPDEPDKPLDNIFEVMDLNDIPGYKTDAKLGDTIKCEFTEVKFYKMKLKDRAKDFLAEYKETFKSYACGLLGDSFASEYGSLYDSVLENYINSEENLTKKDVGLYCYLSYKTKDLVDGFLEKLDEAIKDRIPSKTEEE